MLMMHPEDEDCRYGGHGAEAQHEGQEITQHGHRLRRFRKIFRDHRQENGKRQKRCNGVADALARVGRK